MLITRRLSWEHAASWGSAPPAPTRLRRSARALRALPPGIPKGFALNTRPPGAEFDPQASATLGRFEASPHGRFAAIQDWACLTLRFAWQERGAAERFGGPPCVF